MNISIDEIPMPVAPASFSVSTGSNPATYDSFPAQNVSDSVAWRKAKEALIKVAKESNSASSVRFPEVTASNFQQVYTPPTSSYFYPYYYPQYAQGYMYPPMPTPSNYPRPVTTVNPYPVQKPVVPVVPKPPPSTKFTDNHSFGISLPSQSAVSTASITISTPSVASTSRLPSNGWQFPERKTLLSTKVIPTTSSASESVSQSNLVNAKGGDSSLNGTWSSKKMPEGAKKYVIRAMEHAHTVEDEEKIEKMLRSKLLPLLESGIAWRMNWMNEPLPTDPEFKLPPSNAWIPAADLKKPHRLLMRTQKLGCGRNVFGAGPRSRSPTPDVKDSKRDHSKERRRKLKHITDDVEAVSLVKKRKTPYDGKKRKESDKACTVADNFEESNAKRKRAERFGIDSSASEECIGETAFLVDKVGDQRSDFSFVNSQRSVVVGTCQEVEKGYLRLTTYADPSQVRPEYILKQSLALVKQQWKENCSYSIVCDRLKSIRQDLMVQRIRNEFTVEVYETHARIALQNTDKEEFNQCQSQLKMLYEAIPNCSNECEFVAYRILFFVFTQNSMDIKASLSRITASQRGNTCVQFACEFCQAWMMGNFRTLFQLYKNGSPKLCSYLVALVLDRERKRSIRNMIKAYRPTRLPISFVMDVLAFDDQEEFGNQVYMVTVLLDNQPFC
uniref:SAC3/GANP/THP3 conserved domain-containing protein n=1 Tax=Trichuris muris TaxID=70415 RepID=A0A5S6QQU7_TRIMR